MKIELPPWLDGPRRLLEQAFAGPRPPHALLLRAAEGLGAERLGTWIAARVLCQAGEARPCGRCRACVAVERDTHPDLISLSPLEDSKQIRIDEIRDLIADFGLKSHQGGYKVAIIHPAETLNMSAANALLKTLEEPPQNTLLVLVTHRRARLPATIVSRCQQLAIAAPTPAAARAWLERELPRSDSATALRFARGAPLRAAELMALGFADLDREMTDAMTELARAALDVPAVADRWTRSGKADLPMRLLWLETWVTETIISGMTGGKSARPGAETGLPAAVETLKIRAQYGVLDRLRQMKITSLTSLNLTMAIESLLLDLGTALASASAAQRKQGGRK